MTQDFDSLPKRRKANAVRSIARDLAARLSLGSALAWPGVAKAPANANRVRISHQQVSRDGSAPSNA
jgi:hypothetical protein